MPNLTSLKKKLLDIFDEDFFGHNVSESNQILNLVGKVNVGWNVGYIKSLPKFDLLIDVGAADDFHNLHMARKDAISILIDANKNYSKLYQDFFKKRRGYFEICAVGSHIGKINYTFY